MAQTGILLFATILLSPLLILFSAGGFFLGKRLRLFPVGVPGLLNFVLVACFGLGSLSLYITVDTLVMTPAYFQEAYLGARYASPAQLRRAEIVPAMMDPWSEYRYQLGPAEATALRRRCRSTYSASSEVNCVLFSDRDERWFAEVTLSHGDELRILDGLH